MKLTIISPDGLPIDPFASPYTTRQEAEQALEGWIESHFRIQGYYKMATGERLDLDEAKARSRIVACPSAEDDEVGSNTWPEDAERCRLAREVFDKVFNHAESFRENDLGADLAYLLGAILDEETPGTGRSWVDWSCETENTVRIFRELFPPDHDVWRFIEL